MHDAYEPLIWGVWVSLCEQSFKAWLKVFEQEHRSNVGPFFGLNAWLKPYPDTMILKTRGHLRDHGLRPLIELEAAAFRLLGRTRSEDGCASRVRLEIPCHSNRIA